MSAVAPLASRSPFTTRTVMFDLDGTLVHSAPDLALAVNRMLQDLERAPQPLEQIMHWIGNGMLRLVKRALTGEMHGEPQAPLCERALALFQKHYGENLSVHTRPYPGTMQALELLTTRGFALVCVTNKAATFSLPLLEKMNLAKFFKLVVSGDTTPVRKPDPQPLLHACEHFNIAPQEAVFVGDSANDVHAARAAGMPIICVSYGYNHGRDVRELAPDVVVDSLAEVPQYLQLQTV